MKKKERGKETNAFKVSSVDLGAGVHEEGDHAGSAVEGSKVEGSFIALVFATDGGTIVEEKFHKVVEVLLGGKVQCRHSCLLRGRVGQSVKAEEGSGEQKEKQREDEK